MSEGLSLALFLHDAGNADTKKRLWLQGSRITKDNLQQGTGAIQRCTAVEWFKKKGAAVQHKSPSVNRTGPTMGFGKYRDRLMADVSKDDPGYFAWCIETVKGFEARWAKLQQERSL